MRHRRLLIISVVTLWASATVRGAVLFDFNNAPIHTSLPIDLTVDGIAAHFSATGQGFSIQDTAQVIGVLPAWHTIQEYRLVDAAIGEFERGYIMVEDMVTRQPWADDVPVHVHRETAAGD